MTDNKEILRDDDIIRTDEGLIFNPYNPVNIKITLSEVQSILSKYGLPTTVDNMALYERAFVHRSYTKRPNFENIQQNITIVERPPDCMPLSSKSNERLEFLGDGVLECVTKYLLYRRFPKADEGFMTEKKIAIVKNEAIGKIALEMGLHKWLILSKHAEEKKIRTNLKKLGCLFEAFVGAVFLDFNKTIVTDEFTRPHGIGFQIAQTFIENIFEKHIDWVSLICNDDNYKNILQVKIQKEFKVTPHYIEIKNDDNGYEMGVYLCLGQDTYHLKHEHAIPISFFQSYQSIHDYVHQHGKILLFMGHGLHKIKKKAEQLACCEALKCTLSTFLLK
jgi:dsRNA-specific ribonuclease